MEAAVFVIASALVLVGALGVVMRKHPVHCALSLVMTLFGVAVLFIAQDAQFLAAVQVIVYAGAIVVLFLFVIMLLGVDRAENLRVDTLKGQRPAAAVVGIVGLGLTLTAILLAGHRRITGTHSLGGAIVAADPTKQEENVRLLARSIFGDNVLAFEVTSVLLVIAVVGTLILARRPPRTPRAPAPADAAPTAASTKAGGK
jgi:NADH-quinone oxidoreductase subunit J